MINRAYASLVVKYAADGEAQRVITGTASTPTPDRHGDILDPLGATFTNPLVLLLHHDTKQPVGTVRLLPPTADGISFEATLATVTDPGSLKDRVDEAWQSIKAGLIRGVSVGFRHVGKFSDAVELLKSGGLRFKATEICELSLVTVPANLEASIRTIKSIDLRHLAATGQSPDPAPRIAPVRKDAMTMTTAEQIKTWETTRAAKLSAIETLIGQVNEADTTFNEDQKKHHDELRSAVTEIDDTLTRLRDHEKMMGTQATPVPTGVPARTVAPVTVLPTLPKGTAFTRMVMARVASGGDKMAAIEYAKRWHDSTPEVELMLKAAVAPGTTTDPAWAGPLVVITNAANEFIELLRPATILGRLPNLRQIPFNTQVPMQTVGGSYAWTGQGAPKAVSALAFAPVVLTFAKATGIIVITEELARLSTPSAEAIIRNDMVKGMAQFLDTQFTDPTVAAVANVSPASITNGTTAIATAGDPLKDIRALIEWFASQNMSIANLVIVMSETNGFMLASTVNALGARVFPNMSATGGTVEGVTVITSNVVGNNIIGIQPSYILYADEGGVNIDVSREASVQMNSAPDNPVVATTVLTSLWQSNLVGLRAERFINWQRAKLEAVKYVSGAVYPAGAVSEGAPAGEPHATHVEAKARR